MLDIICYSLPYFLVLVNILFCFVQVENVNIVNHIKFQAALAILTLQFCLYQSLFALPLEQSLDNSFDILSWILILLLLKILLKNAKNDMDKNCNK